MIRLLIEVQTLYFLLTGIWPLLHYRSFEWATGPKTDKWLVKTFTAYITVVGLTLAVALLRNELNPAILVLAAGTAGVLATADIYFVSKRTISPIYLGDALVELVFFIPVVLQLPNLLA